MTPIPDYSLRRPYPRSSLPRAARAVSLWYAELLEAAEGKAWKVWAAPLVIILTGFGDMP